MKHDVELNRPALQLVDDLRATRAGLAEQSALALVSSERVSLLEREAERRAAELRQATDELNRRSNQ